ACESSKHERDEPARSQAMRFSLSKFVGAAAFAAVLGAGSLAWAGVPAPQVARPIPPDRQAIAPSTSALFSSSGLGRIGDFSGTIVSLSCDSVHPLGSSTECEATGHYYALEMDGDRASYPLLLLGTQPSLDKLRAGEFTGKQVDVTGVHYSSSGTILVSG